VSDEEGHAAPAFFAAYWCTAVEVADDFGVGDDFGEGFEVVLGEDSEEQPFRAE
jgi:hypothetical protein